MAGISPVCATLRTYVVYMSLFWSIVCQFAVALHFWSGDRAERCHPFGIDVWQSSAVFLEPIVVAVVAFVSRWCDSRCWCMCCRQQDPTCGNQCLFISSSWCYATWPIGLSIIIQMELFMLFSCSSVTCVSLISLYKYGKIKLDSTLKWSCT